MTDPIKPSAVRYIKLGSKGSWLKDCVRLGRVALGHDETPHDLALAGEWAGVAADARARGRSPATASQDAREVRDFYALDENALWITFDGDHLWWTFAERGVLLNEVGEGPGSRWRASRGGWRNTDIHGRPLRVEALKSKLALTRNYQRTICQIAASEYLIRRINGASEVIVESAKEAQRALVAAARALIEDLHPKDFELMVDLIFTRSGWRRCSVIGETMKDADLLLEQAATEERAFVQVKSRAGQAVLDDYIARYKRRGDYGRMFFVCHSPRGALKAADAAVKVWTGETLAEQAVRAGLTEWLIARAA